MDKQQIVIPAQIRAGRALIGWSQEQLAEAAEVALSTIRDFEGLRGGGVGGGLLAMCRALENEGVVFVAANDDGGPGARLAGRRPNIIRAPTKMGGYEQMPFNVEWRGKTAIVFVPRNVLDDFDGARERRTDAEFVKSFGRHRASILRAAAAAMDAGRVTPDERVYLEPGDFPELL